LSAPERELTDQPGSEAAPAEERKIEQRRPSTLRETQLVAGEGREQERGEAEARECPGGPTVLASLDQRQKERRQGCGEKRDPREVECGGE